MSKKLAAKASLIQLPPLPAVSPGPARGGPQPAADDAAAGAPAGATESGWTGSPRPKTAPGSMAHFMASQSVAIREAEVLREKLRQFDGAVPVLALDARLVRASRWANRHPEAFADDDFQALKAEIASAGGNVQPASVRRIDAGPMPGAQPSAGSADAGATPSSKNAARDEAAPAGDSLGPARYELVFGHRRHRACLELGLPLQAMVVQADDRQLFEAMERENRSRKNLSAWEQGRFYRRALDEGLYPSQRRLAEALGVDVALVSKSLSLARLPAAVVAAFASPLQIQFRWAQPLAQALQRDPEGVVARAQALREGGPSRPAAAVFQALVTPAAPGVAAVAGRSSGPTPTRPRRAIPGVRWVHDARGALNLRFDAGLLDEAAQAQLAQWLRQFVLGLGPVRDADAVQRDLAGGGRRR